MATRGEIIRAPKGRVWLAIFLVGFLIVLATGYWFLRREIQEIRREKFRDLAAIAEMKVNQVVEWRKERLRDAINLSKSPLFISAIKEWLAKPTSSGLRHDILESLRLTKKAYGYANIYFIDKEGQPLLSLEEEVVPVEATTKQTMEEAMARGKAVFSDLYRSPSGRIYLDSLAPVLDDGGSLLGVLILRNDARSFLFPLLESWPAPSRTAESILVKREGKEVLFLNDLRHRTDAPLTFRLPLIQTSLCAVQAVLGKKGSFEGKDYRGVTVLAELRPVPDSSWFIAAKMDRSEILAGARYQSAKTILIVVLLVLVAAGVGLLGYRQQRSRFFASLYQAERKQRETQEELRTTLYSIGDAVITTDQQGKVKVMNQVAENLTGWSEGEARGKALAEVFHIINEETRAEVENPVERVLREGVVVGLANHSLLITRDGREIPIADAGAPIRDEKEAILGVVLVFRDQTEERAAQRALHEAKEFAESIIATVREPLVVLDAEMRVVAANRSFYATFEARPEETLGKLLYDLGNRQWDIPELRELLEKILPLNTSFSDFEVVHDFPHLGRRTMLLNARRIYREANKTEMILLAIEDITERRRAEEALRASEEKYRILHEFAGEAIFTFTTDLKLLEINRAACEYVGYDRKELLGKNIFELGILHPEEMVRATENLTKILSGEKPVVVDKFHFKGKHGLYGTFQVTSTPVIRNGEVVAVTNVCRDVTIEERLYAALEASERRYRFLFNAGNDAVLVYNLTDKNEPGKIIEVNDLASSLTGYSKAELLELTPLDLVVPEEREQVFESNHIISKKKHRVFERTLVTKDGQRIPCEISSHFFELNGVPTVMAIARDITERKKAEENLKAALKEKDIMLREIHHRVKNNMQIMSSLLRLQARQVSDDKARQAFKESQTRIRSMAMIHEKLYQSRDFASIDFGDYIEKMVTHLYVVYQVDPKRVRFKEDVRAVELDINRAIPCGLIVNELVSNALKYAFAGEKEGELSVTMFKDDAGKFHLLVKDTGVGLPRSIDIQRAQTLGLQIVSDLVKQLEGKVEVRRDGGTEFEIVF